MNLVKCGRSGKVLRDPAAEPSARYVCSGCGKAFASQRQVTGHLSVCPVRQIERLPKETVIKTPEGTWIITRTESSAGVNLAGIPEIDDKE